jgi:hypothetical protein
MSEMLYRGVRQMTGVRQITIGVFRLEKGEVKGALKMLIENCHESKRHLNRRRKISESCRAMTHVGLDEKIAALKWAVTILESRPDSVEIDIQGNEHTVQGENN